MHKPLFRIAVGSVAAVGGLIAASALPAGAATAGRAETMAQTVTCDNGGVNTGDCATTPVTFTVTTTGTLAITAPTGNQALGTAAQDLTGTKKIGTAGTSNFAAVTVNDTRAESASTWTASVSTTAFTVTGTSASIPADDATYATNGVKAVSGHGFAAADIADDTSSAQNPLYTATPITMSSIAATAIVTENGFDGDNEATWSPTIVVTVPADALVGAYTGTVTHSVA